MAGETRKNVYLPQLDEIRDAILTGHASGADAATLDALFRAMINGENTTKIFRDWWPLARAQDSASDDTTVANRYHTLDRWFKLLGDAWAGKYYTLRGPDYRVNSTGVTTLTPLGDLADKAAAVCATEVTPDTFDWADEDPMTWYLRFNGLSLSDGTMNVLAVEGVDDEFDISGYSAPVYTGSLALWKHHYTDGSYEYKTFATVQHGAMRPYARDVDPSGNKRHMTWHSTFPGQKFTKNNSTCITSGTIGKPAIRTSGTDGIGYARNVSSYEGLYSDTDRDWLIDAFQLRHFNLENSGIIEGCTNYNYQYTVAVAETGAKSVVLSTANAANLLVGSSVSVGSHPSGTNNDRNTGNNYNLADCVKITRIEAVTIDGTTYSRVHLDIDSGIDVPATGFVSTMPWYAGSTEALPGHKDGSISNLTNGKTPARIAGVECIDGAYSIGLDPLMNENFDDSRNPKNIYTFYEVKNSTKQAGSITSDYSLLSSQFETNAKWSWDYIKHFEIRTDGMLVPDLAGGSSSTFMKSAFLGSSGSSVRAPWVFGDLNGSGYCGLACCSGGSSPGSALWLGRPRLSGAGKIRGEWAA